jgi:TniQ/Bacterial regulatory helix-turn-helix protein, lysR family
MTPTRTFPIRLLPLPGEALDSWLEALAHRMHTELGDVLARASGHVGGTRDWAVLLGPGEAAGIAAATGVPQRQVEAMTLAAYDGTAVRTDRPNHRVSHYQLWGRATGSRYCPDCLAETDGRWLLVWRLGWSFACPAHRRLLADTCPVCGRRQRHLPSPAHLIPQPGRCAWPAPGRNGPSTLRCAADLTCASTAVFPAGHPVLAVQQLLLTMISSGTAAFGVYGSDPQPTATTLADVRALANRILRSTAAGELASIVPADLLAACHRAQPAGAPRRPGFMAPRNAATAAAGVTAAVAVLGAAGIPAAGAVLRGLIEGSLRRGTTVTSSSLKQWSADTSPVLTAVQLSALDPLLDPFFRLRYRSAASRPCLPSSGTASTARRARRVPALFWPALSLRLAVPGCGQQYLRRALSCAVLAVGTSQQVDDLPGWLGTVIDAPGISRVLGLLEADPHGTHILQALIKVAGYLDANGSPIDYQRRRDLTYDDLLPDDAWFTLCRRLCIPTGTRKAAIARSVLFERLSGLPASHAPFPADDSGFRYAMASFPAYLTPDLVTGLHDAAVAFLHRHQIRDEPASWHPPLTLLSGLDLPGPDPRDLDITAAHRSIRQGREALQATAEQLGTTLDAVRYLLEEHPAPRSPLANGQVLASARAVLPGHELAELYLDRRMSLREIGRQLGVSRQTIASLARDYGIPLRTGKSPRTVIDRAWLYEQYVTRRRSLTELADETDMTERNMARWARIHNIPIGPRGGPRVSYPPQLRGNGKAADIPAILLPALQGASAWQRLQRFAAAAPYPGMSAAAAGLGLNPATLITQINRLERDLGGQLLVRARRGQAMTLTPFGAEVASAVARTQELTVGSAGRVKNDAAAEKGRRELELALARKITTRIGKQCKAPVMS